MLTLNDMAKKLANAILVPEAAEGSIRELNAWAHEAAKAITGVRADQLMDENLEDKPIVRLYWSTVSQLISKVLMEVAQMQTYYKEVM